MRRTQATEQLCPKQFHRKQSQQTPSGLRALLMTAALLMTGLLITAALLMSAAPAAGAQSTGADGTIRSQGVGAATIGSTRDQLQTQLGPGWEFIVANDVLVDLYGFDVLRDGEHQFYALGGFDEPEMTVFVIDTTGYATAAGVGPGLSLREAEAIYGEATLQWNPDNESREFVTFDNGPEGRLFFRARSGDDFRAGIYADGTFETSDYAPDATISAIWVTCGIGVDCPQLAFTGPQHTAWLLNAGLLLTAAGLALVGLGRRYSI